MNIREIDIGHLNAPLLSITNAAGDLPPVCLLESTLYNKETGRYSIAGAFPFLVLEGMRDGCALTYFDAGGEIEMKREIKGDPFVLLEQQYALYNTVPRTDYPLWGGAIGFFSYEMLYYSDIVGPFAAPSRQGMDVPLYWFAFYDIVCVEDKGSGKMSLLATDIGCRAKNGNAYIEKKAALFQQCLVPPACSGSTRTSAAAMRCPGIGNKQGRLPSKRAIDSLAYRKRRHFSGVLHFY